MKVTGIILQMVAAVLPVCGLEVSGDIHSDFSRCFRGVATVRTVWLFVGSAGAGVMGVGLLFSPRSQVA